MLSPEQYAHEARGAVVDTAQAFHLKASAGDGSPVSAPCSYQILEPGFRPFRAGKASPKELQDELDGVLGQAQSRGIDPGIEGQEAIRKLSVQLGLGIDCSNFAYHTLARLHDRLGFGSYTDHVFRSGAEIRELHANKESWAARDEDGNPRQLTTEESDKLRTSEFVAVTWIEDVFNKDPEFIIGSHHMSSPEAAEQVLPQDVLPGDLIAFNKAGNGRVSHIAVVEKADALSEETMRMDFWHSWHTRDFQSGLRRDAVQTNGVSSTWSHDGLADPTRYSGYFFCRPMGTAALTATFL